jgi:hypothetical protein
MPASYNTVLQSMLATAMLVGNGSRLPWQGPFDHPCHQTYEFGNQGCTGLVVLAERPEEPLPWSFYYHIGATSLRQVSDIGYGSMDYYDTIPPEAQLRLIRWGPGSGDTESVRITAVIIDRTERSKGTGQYKTVAFDSVLKVVRFAPIGELPLVDTVRLALRRP